MSGRKGAEEEVGAHGDFGETGRGPEALQPQRPSWPFGITPGGGLSAGEGGCGARVRTGSHWIRRRAKFALIGQARARSFGAQGCPEPGGWLWGPGAFAQGDEGAFGIPCVPVDGGQADERAGPGDDGAHGQGPRARRAVGCLRKGQ